MSARADGKPAGLLTPLYEFVVLFGELVFRYGKTTQEFTALRARRLLPAWRRFSAVFSRIHAATAGGSESKSIRRHSLRALRSARTAYLPLPFPRESRQSGLQH